ncbi:capsule biosynthesis GfcC family protein [Vibrio sp. PP-XX7]
MDNTAFQCILAMFLALTKSFYADYSKLAHTGKSVDWLSSGLYDTDTVFTEKQQALAVVAKQQKIASQRYHGSWYYWSQLGNNLDAMHFAKRIFQSIDPDETRLNKQLNPQLIGHWFISLRKPQKSVFVLGGVLNPGKQPWQPRHDARSYASSAGLFDSSIPVITVIQPDGHVEKHPVGYWNQTFSEVAPGAIIYVPLLLKHYQ